MRDRFGHFLAAAALEALRIDHDYIVKILDAAVAQNFAARQIRRSGCTSSRARSSVSRASVKWANLQEAEFGYAVWALDACAESVELRQTDGEFYLHGIAQRIFSGPNQDIENLSQRKCAVLEHGGKGHDARSGAAHSIVDGMVVARVS